MRLCYPEQSRPEMDEAIRSQTYRKYLDCLTDHQWEHAVGESLRLEKFFPAVSTLLEYAEHAPPTRLLDWTGECGLCAGTGFEPFERGGVQYVRICPRGCKPHNDKLDGPKPREYRAGAVPFPEAKGILERLQAICREKTAQGLEGFKYVGIEADMAAEAKPVKPAKDVA